VCWEEAGVRAAILVTVEPGTLDKVLSKVKGVKGITDAFSVAGRVDIAVVAEAADIKALTGVVLRVNGVEGVSTTETLVEAQP